MKRVRKIAFAVVVLAVISAGCGDDSSSGGGDAAPGATSGGGATATTVAQPVAGGKMVWMTVAETRGMDPIQVTGASGASGEPPRMHAIYDSLVITDNKTAEVRPALAESLTSPDNIVWTFKLRPNVKFSDSTALDAEAVKFNMERHADPANNSTARTTVTGFKSIEIVDPLTVRVTLSTENGQFPRVVASQLAWIASPTAVKTHGKSYGTTPDKIVGAGPFTMVEWTRDSRMVMKKNPNYWQAGKPYLDELEVRINSDETQRFNGLNAGEVDLAAINTLTTQKQAKDANFTILPYNTIGSNGFNLNMQKEPFNDARIRRAFQLAVDPVQLNQVATDGLGQPITSWFAEGSTYFDPSGTFPKFNAAEAQKLVDAYVAEKGKNVEFTITSPDSPQTVKIAEFMAASMNKLQKVSVKLASAPQQQTTTLLRNRDYQAISYAFLGPDPEPQWYETWHSKGTRNYTGYSNPAMDESLLKARNAKDAATRKAQYAIGQKLLVDDGAPMIPYIRSVSAMVYKSSKVQSLEVLEDGGVVAWDKIWIKK